MLAVVPLSTMLKTVAMDHVRSMAVVSSTQAGGIGILSLVFVSQVLVAPLTKAKR